jgi:hypothetical protein
VVNEPLVPVDRFVAALEGIADDVEDPRHPTAQLIENHSRPLREKRRQGDSAQPFAGAVV